jgi:hypothetical protein
MGHHRLKKELKGMDFLVGRDPAAELDDLRRALTEPKRLRMASLKRVLGEARKRSEDFADREIDSLLKAWK